MAKIIFVTGGVQSGKARWAVNYFGSMDHVKYMCIYENLEDTISDRINFHCEKNAVAWAIETNAKSLEKLVKGHKFAILDNLAEYTNRAIREKCSNLKDLTAEIGLEAEKQVIDEITELIWEVKEIDGTLLILSVELGFSPVPADRAQRIYRRVLGSVNQRIANQSSEVYLMVSGIPSKIK